MSKKYTFFLAGALILLLTVFLTTGVSAEDSTFSVNGVTYHYDDSQFTIEEGGCLTGYKGPGGDVMIPNGVTSIGSFAFGNRSDITSLTIPSGVKSIGSMAFFLCSGMKSITIPSSVTNIEDNAFCGCSNLTSITIPSGVTRIGAGTFQSCRGLTSITIPENVTSIGESAFSGCLGLTTITIPSGVTSIGRGAFSECIKLTSITIPSSVTSLEDSIFLGCSSLKSITLPSSVASIGAEAFRGCTGLTSITIPSGVISIGEQAFFECTRLTSITLPESLLSIGKGAFRGCSSLTTITLPSSLTSLGSEMLAGCKNLTSLTIPDGVTSIGESALSGCTGLTSLTIPDGVTSIGAAAFAGCTGLTSIQIPDSVTSIGDLAFQNCSKVKSLKIPDGVTSISYGLFAQCYALESVTIPTSVTSIGESAFSRCYRLANITIPSGVTSIGVAAFIGCSDLTSITIPSGVTRIGASTFDSCVGLTSITIPSSVTSIDYRAFFSCYGLTSITIPSGVTNIETAAFGACFGLESIFVDEDNPFYHVEGNCLIETAGKTLIAACKTSVIPANGSVTSIADYAFYLCTDLTAISIPSSVKAIGQYAFYDCHSLTNITFGENSQLMSIGEHAFEECSELTSITIPSGVKSIGAYAFKDCTYLTSIMLDANSPLSSIGDSLLDGCVNLHSFTIPSSVTYIGSYAFFDCQFTSITIPSGVASIGEYAFSGCPLKSIKIPSGVTYIGAHAFANCVFLSSISCEATSRPAGWDPNWNSSKCPVTWGWSGNTLVFVSNGDGTCFVQGVGSCTDSDIVIPPNSPDGDIVTGIGLGAFMECIHLKSVTIPSGVTSIGSSAFCFCENLTSLTIPDSVTSIGKHAFEGCVNITDITIPNHVESIGECAFYNCTGLTSITIPKSVNTMGEKVFANCISLVISCEASFRPSGWDVNWNISRCPAVWEYTESPNAFLFESNGDGTCYVSGIFLCNDKDIVIPSVSPEGDTVTGIGKDAFLGQKDITSLIVPTGVTDIGYRAFYGCSSLMSIVLPDSIESIGEKAFDGTGFYLEERNWDGDALYLGTALLGVRKNSAETFRVKIGTKVMADALFADITSVTSVILPYGIKTIPKRMFYRCSSLTNVEIPASIMTIQDEAFLECESLDSFVIPSGVTGIGFEAFRYCRSLTELTVPSTVAFMGYGVFSECFSLTIYCDAASQPESWNSDWNIYGGVVRWNDGHSHQCGGYEHDDAEHWKVCDFCAEHYDVEPHTGEWVLIGENLLERVCVCGFSEVKTIEEGKLTLSEKKGENVVLSGESLDCIDELTVQIGNIAVSYDGLAVSSISESIGTESISIHVHYSDGEDLSENQRDVMFGSPSGTVLISLEVSSQDTSVHDFSGGTATVTLPFEIPTGWNEDDIQVYRINEDGSKEKIPTSYEQGSVSFVTDGHSFYSVAKKQTCMHENMEHRDSIEPSCTAGAKEYWCCTDCGSCFVDKEGRLEVTEIIDAWKQIPGFGHSFGEVSYIWDGDTCTATRVCAHDAQHVETETVTGAYVKDTDASCLANETGHYAVVFRNPAFAGQSTEASSVEIANTSGHRYGDVTYLWNGDQCTAMRVCALDPQHVETETVIGTYVRDTEPDCLANETGHYEVVFRNPAFAGQSTEASSVEIPDSKGRHVRGAAQRENEIPPTVSADGSYDEVVYCANCHEELSRTTHTIPRIEGQLSLTTAAVTTAWGCTFTVDVTATQLAGEGGEFTILVDLLDATLVRAGAVSKKATVTVYGQMVKVKVNGKVTAGEKLVTLTLKASDELPSGNTAYLSVEDTANRTSFQPLTVFEMGDVNMDGKINSRDAVMIQQYAVKMITFTDVQMVLADVSCDGKINSRDAVLIQQFAVKMPVTLGDRVKVEFVSGTTVVAVRTVPKGKTLKTVPAAAEGKRWSGSSGSYVAPVFTNLTSPKKYYLVSK